MQQWEAQAIEANRQDKEKIKISFQDTPSSALASTSKTNDVGPSGTTNIQVSRTDANSSITLVYTPPPRRIFKRSAALQSPYAEAAPKISFKCSWGVSKVYNAVCMCSGRSTRGNNRKYVCIHPATYFQSYFYLTKKFLTLFFCRALVINYKSTFAILGDLVDSVKPEGRLKNTIAEVGIYVLNGKNKSGATRFVMPLYVTVSGMNIFIFFFVKNGINMTSSHPHVDTVAKQSNRNGIC